MSSGHLGSHILQLSQDELAGPGEISLPAIDGSRVIYVVEGELVRSVDGRTCRENSAFFADEACILSSPSGTRLWRWELLRAPAAAGHSSANQPGPIAVHPVQLDPNQTYLMRCDRVDFPPQGIAHTHVHAGPGIRILLEGTIRIQVDGHQTALSPGEAWFERGPDPVLALADEEVPTSFVRTMILPRAFEGRSSIRYVLPEDADKPKVQQYTRFVEEPIEY